MVISTFGHCIRLHDRLFSRHSHISFLYVGTYISRMFWHRAEETRFVIFSQRWQWRFYVVNLAESNRKLALDISFHIPVQALFPGRCYLAYPWRKGSKYRCLGKARTYLSFSSHIPLDTPTT